MVAARITLTTEERERIQAISQRTGQTPDELVHCAIERMLAQFPIDPSLERRRERLRKAAGLWKDRDDLPDFEQLRSEWSRFGDWGRE